MDIAKRIREIREGKKLRQADLAEKLGLEISNYSRLEKRDKKLTLEQIESIAHALGVSVKDILYPEMLANSPTDELERKLELEGKEKELLQNTIELLQREKALTARENALELQALQEINEKLLNFIKQIPQRLDEDVFDLIQTFLKDFEG